YLAVPYEARDQVKSLGGRWDREAKAWFIPLGANSEPFKQWERTAAPADPDRDPREQFADELRRAGFRLSGAHPVMDGKIHRIAVDGDKETERNGSYRAFADGVPNGWLQNFKTHPALVPWKANTPTLPPEQRAALKATAEAKTADDRRARDLAADQAAQRAVEILSAATPAIGHAYLTTKQVKSEGLFIAFPGTTIETESGKQIDIAG